MFLHDVTSRLYKCCCSIGMLMQSCCVGSGWCCIGDPPLANSTASFCHFHLFIFKSIPPMAGGLAPSRICILLHSLISLREAVRLRCKEQSQLSACRRGFFFFLFPGAQWSAGELNKKQINSCVSFIPSYRRQNNLFYRLSELCLSVSASVHDVSCLVMKEDFFFLQNRVSKLSRSCQVMQIPLANLQYYQYILLHLCSITAKLADVLKNVPITKHVISPQKKTVR